MKELIIFVPVLPTLQGYTHWTKAAKITIRFGRVVKLYALDALHLWQREHNQAWEPLPRARVRLEFFWPTGRRGPMPDLKNLEAVFKPGIDALTARVRGEDKDSNPVVGAGILEDDGPENIDWQPTLLSRGDFSGVRITIVES